MRLHSCRCVAIAIGLAALASGCASGHSSRQKVGAIAKAVVGVGGGTLTSADGNLTITVPPAALSADIDLTIQQYVNTAPAGQGNVYELGPAGQVFALPVTLAFKNPTLAATTPVPTTSLWASFLVNQSAPGAGLWFRAATLAVDGTANTLTASVADLGWTEWTVVGAGPNIGHDLVGNFTLVSTLEVPFTATATLTLAYSGEDGRAVYFFPVGAMTIATPVTIGGATCTPVAPSALVKSDAVVELRKGVDPVPLLLSVDATWPLTCSNGTSDLADTRFDTLGINLGSCTHRFVGTPLLTAAKIECDTANGCAYLIDCGARGQETATFAFAPCTPGVACTSANACHTAAIVCTTGFPVCTDNGNVANGTGCGTNQVCGGGVCNACTQGGTCTSTNLCDATATFECTSGFAVCTDRTFVAAGTACGSGNVCSPAGACIACSQGTTCTPAILNPCAATSTVECSSGGPVCTDRTFVAAGTSCGIGNVCSPAGVCAACSQGTTCAPTTVNPCATSSTTECSSGGPVCTDRTFVAAGTSCGTGQVCSAAGVCGACSQGTTCAPTTVNPCATSSTTECSSGGPVCTDRTFVPAGTSCGAGQVCSAAGVCGACGQGTICAPTIVNPCATSSTTECSSGGPVCTDRTFLAAGTSCGAGQVCSAAGVCGACGQGTACTPTTPNPCAATSTVECSSGGPVCTNRTFLAAGTSCGAGQVCSAAGVCGACGQGTTCTPTTPNPCAATSTVECGSGAPVCTDRTFLAAGTSCGAGQVCSAAGVCGACGQGTTCTPTTPNPCAATSTVECVSGAPVCTDRTFVAAGTSCGAGQVCSAAGVCGACGQGTTCTPTTPNPCAATSTVECSTGAPVCTDRTFVAAGTSCGAGQVCSAAGVCGACGQGTACTPTTPNPCAVTSTVECSSGAPVCTDRTFLVDGTTCGSGLTCNAGACVASRTVTGTRTVTAWPDGGPAVAVPAPELQVVPPAAPVSLAALVPNGKGGWVAYPGTFPSPGTFSIPSVPVGAFLLEYVDAFGFLTLVDATASTVDLGYDQAGRSGLAPASASTLVTFGLAGLTPWNTAGDRLEITSSNAGLWDVLVPSPSFGAGATSGTAIDDWLTGNTSGVPLPLLAPADVLYLHQLSTATDASSGQAFQQASSWTSLTGTTLVSGTPATLAPAPLAAISPLAGSLPAATWSLSQFNLASTMNPAATTNGTAHSLVVGASPFPLGAAGPVSRGSPRLLLMQLPAGTAPDPALGALAYGRFLDTAWKEWMGVDFTVHVSYAAPAASPVDLTASIGRREAMPSAGGTITPTLTPVLSPQLGAASAFSTLTGLGASPTLSWAAPAKGLPTRYMVEIFWLHAQAGASAATPVATWVTAGRSLAFPPGVLQAGNTYLARITAYAVAADPYAAATPAPLRLPGAYAYASVLTGTFAP